MLLEVFTSFELVLAHVSLIWPCVVISTHTCNNIILSLLTQSACLMCKFKAAILAKHFSGNESGSAFPMARSNVEHFQHVKYCFDLRAFICPGGKCFGVSKDLFTPIKCFFPLFTSSYWSNIHTWKQSKASKRKMFSIRNSKKRVCLCLKIKYDILCRLCPVVNNYVVYMQIKTSRNKDTVVADTVIHSLRC